MKKKTTKKKIPIKRKTNNSLYLKWKIIIAVFLLLAMSPFYYGYVIKTINSTWYWMKGLGHDEHYRTYKSFNIRIPDKYTIHGIDVSYYQGKIDWHRVKAMRDGKIHISFAFIKATEGVLIVDPYFQRNWREAAKAGIICGAYHYLRPKVSGKWQAKFFLQNAKTVKGNLPMVVDVEELDGVAPAIMRTTLSAFLKEVEKKTKIKPIIYSGLKFYQDNLESYFDDYTLWIAHYYQPQLKISELNNWKFWQHSDKARVNGINHIVDFDVFSGDSLAFRKILVK